MRARGPQRTEHWLFGIGGALLVLSPLLPWLNVVLLGSIDLFQLTAIAKSAAVLPWAMVVVGIVLIIAAITRVGTSGLAVASGIIVLVALVFGSGDFVSLMRGVHDSRGLASLGIGAYVGIAALGVLATGAIRVANNNSSAPCPFVSSPPISVPGSQFGPPPTKRLPEAGPRTTRLLRAAQVSLVVLVILAIAIPLAGQPNARRAAAQDRAAQSDPINAQRAAAQDRAAQSDLTNALTSANATYANTQSYPATTSMVADLRSSEPSLSYTSGTTTGGDQVSVAVANTAALRGQRVVMVAKSGSGTCWAVSRDFMATAGASTLFAAWAPTIGKCGPHTALRSAINWMNRYPQYPQRS